MPGAHRNRHGHAAGAADRAGNAAATGRGHPAAVDEERHAEARGAIAAGGGENGGPGAVIAAGAGIGGAGYGQRRDRGGGNEEFGGAEARESGEESGDHG